ncbi:hypothetical protein [Cohnella soli]|uniref:Uncharacterized protein n=1 Tax=Cohnella soli TaxID=425005 RepID=A0ABW0I312_9BACL
MRRNAEMKMPAVDMGVTGALSGRFASDVMDKYRATRREEKGGGPLVFRSAKKEDKKSMRKVSAVDPVRPRVPFSPPVRQPAVQPPIQPAKERVVVERERIVERIVEREKIVERRIPDTREVQRIIIEQRLLREQAVLGTPPSTAADGKARAREAEAGTSDSSQSSTAPLGEAGRDLSTSSKNEKTKSGSKTSDQSSQRQPGKAPAFQASRGRKPADQELSPTSANESAFPGKQERGSVYEDSLQAVAPIAETGSLGRMDEMNQDSGHAEFSSLSRHASFAAALSRRMEWPLSAKPQSTSELKRTASLLPHSRKEEAAPDRKGGRKGGRKRKADAVTTPHADAKKPKPHEGKSFIFLNRKKVREMLDSHPTEVKRSASYIAESGQPGTVESEPTGSSPRARVSASKTQTSPSPESQTPINIPPSKLPQADTLTINDMPLDAGTFRGIRISPASGPKRAVEDFSIGQSRLRESVDTADVPENAFNKEAVANPEVEEDLSPRSATGPIRWRLRHSNLGRFDKPSDEHGEQQLVVRRVGVNNGRPIIVRRDSVVTASTEPLHEGAGESDSRELPSKAEISVGAIDEQLPTAQPYGSSEMTVLEHIALENELKLKRGSLRLSARWIEEALADKRKVDTQMTHRTAATNLSVDASPMRRSSEDTAARGHLRNERSKDDTSGMMGFGGPMPSVARTIRPNGITPPWPLPIRSAVFSAQFAEEAALRQSKFVFRRPSALQGNSSVRAGVKPRPADRPSTQPAPSIYGEDVAASVARPTAQSGGSRSNIPDSAVPIVLRRTKRGPHPVESNRATTMTEREARPTGSVWVPVTKSPVVPDGSLQDSQATKPSEALTVSSLGGSVTKPSEASAASLRGIPVKRSSDASTAGSQVVPSTKLSEVSFVSLPRASVKKSPGTLTWAPITKLPRPSTARALGVPVKNPTGPATASSLARSHRASAAKSSEASTAGLRGGPVTMLFEASSANSREAAMSGTSGAPGENANSVFAQPRGHRSTRPGSAQTSTLISRRSNVLGNAPIPVAETSSVFVNRSVRLAGKAKATVARQNGLTSRHVAPAPESGKPINASSGTMILPGRSDLNRTGIAASAMYGRLGNPTQEAMSTLDGERRNATPSLALWRSNRTAARIEDGDTLGTEPPEAAVSTAQIGPAIHRRAKPARPDQEDAEIAESAQLELRRNAPAAIATSAKQADVPAEPPRIDAEVLKQAVNSLPQLQPDQLADQVYKALMKKMKFEQRLRGF